MPTKTKQKTLGFAAKRRGGKLERFEFELPPLRPYDVLIEISHCGICHSDIHLIDNDWKFTNYPLVPGHEIIGRVVERGELARHAQGTRVGVGWLCDCCRSCAFCAIGEDNCCSKQKATCVDGFGGFAEKIVVDSRSAFAIPDVLASENAAPFLCGGATVYSPLANFGASPVAHIGIVGMGGLGHLAVQFARAYGAEISVFSTSKSKREEALGYGAHHFVLPDEWESQRDKLDLILTTVSSGTQTEKLLPLLRPKGVLCLVGAPQEEIHTNISTLIARHLKIAGSCIAPAHEMEQMLQVAARHNIQAKTEIFALEDVNEAIEKVRQNKVRYRAVLKMR